MSPNNDTPLYAWGYAAVLTVDLVQHIAAGIPHVMMPPNNLLRIEDVATGVWVEYIANHHNANVTYTSRVPWIPTNVKIHMLFYTCPLNIQGRMCQMS